MAVCVIVVEFVIVPKIVDCAVPVAPPVIEPVTVGSDQEYVVPDGIISTPFVGETLNAAALQAVTVLLAITGFGLSVTTTVNVGPTHDPLVGVTVYVAVCCVLVGFVSVPLIFV